MVFGNSEAAQEEIHEGDIESGASMIYEPEKVIEVYRKRIAKSRWEVINQTDQGIQIREAKRMNRLGFWVGLLLIPFWGIGLILWLLTLLDYALQREKIRFVTIDRMIEQLKAAK